MCLISLRDAKFGLVFSPNNCSPLDSKLTASQGSPSSNTATLVIGGSLEIEDLITAWIGICLDVHKVHFLLHICVWKYPLLMWFYYKKHKFWAWASDLTPCFGLLNYVHHSWLHVFHGINNSFQEVYFGIAVLLAESLGFLPPKSEVRSISNVMISTSTYTDVFDICVHNIEMHFRWSNDACNPAIKTFGFIENPSIGSMNDPIIISFDLWSLKIIWEDSPWFVHQNTECWSLGSGCLIICLKHLKIVHISSHFEMQCVHSHQIKCCWQNTLFPSDGVAIQLSSTKLSMVRWNIIPSSKSQIPTFPQWHHWFTIRVGSVFCWMICPLFGWTAIVNFQ